MNYIISEEKIKELGLNRYDFKAVVFAFTESSVLSSLEQNEEIDQDLVDDYLEEVVEKVAEYYRMNSCSYECEKLDDYISEAAGEIGIYKDDDDDDDDDEEEE